MVIPDFNGEGNMENKEEKISIRRLFSNVGYILTYAAKKDKKIVWTLIISFAVDGVLFAAVDALFIKILIELLVDRSVTFSTAAVFAVAQAAVLALLIAVDICVENWARARFVRVTGQIQEEMINKASVMDLMCYDCAEYFDDFVLAASQSEEMVFTSVLTIAQIGENVLVILSLSGFVSFINPVIAIFPVAGFIVNMLTRFKITRLEYEYDMISKKIMRRADYSKRVFYQPEYTKEIKLSHIEAPLKRQFYEAIDDVVCEAEKVGVKIAVLSLINWIVVFTFLSFFCPPLYLGYLALVKKSIRLSDVAALNNAQNNMRGKFDGMNYCMVRFQTVGQFVERFRRFMEYESEIEGKTGTVPVPQGVQALELKDVSFRYDKAEKDTLRHINMTIRPGEKIALVGENGAGKSTFVKLLMRLYDVTDGSICYGGKDIRDFTTSEYRDIFGAVFQDYQIYASSIAGNVLMDYEDGMEKETKERVEGALEKAGFADKLHSMDEGIDTPLTREFEENGVQLSGGEAQKVAIARMFAKKEKMAVAILDEPSSALDPKAEYTLNKNMMDKADGSSVIFISHRLSTTREADCIYMFEKGEVIESGTHEELMELDGRYAQMFKRQAQYYAENMEALGA